MKDKTKNKIHYLASLQETPLNEEKCKENKKAFICFFAGCDEEQCVCVCLWKRGSEHSGYPSRND